MASSCTTLKYQLVEFTSAIQKYQAIESPKPDENIKLYVASPTRIYDENSLINRVKIFFDKIWKWIISKKNESLKVAVEGTIHHLFDQVITEAYHARQNHLAVKIKQVEQAFNLTKNDEQIQGQKKRYYEHLKYELKGANVCLTSLQSNFDAVLTHATSSENEADRLKSLATKVVSAVFPFWYKMLHYKHTFASTLKDFLPSRFSLATTEKPINGAVRDLALFGAFKEELNWINLEAMAGKIPFVELIKICQPNSELDVREKKRLDKWIATLNTYMNDDELKSEVTKKIVEQLKSVIKEIVNISEIQGDLSISYGLLINKLDDRGCLLMRLKDHEHMIWRNSLKKGQKLRCQGEIYRLGEELTTKKILNKKKWKTYQLESKNHHRVFKIANHPNLAVRIGKSPFDLAITSYEHKEYQFGVPHVKGLQNVRETDKGHPVAFMELMPKTIVDHEWTSTGYILNSTDQKILSRIASFLLCMYDWQVWPNEISWEQFFLDAKGRLRTGQLFDLGRRAHMLEKNYCGPDNYLAAEEFCAKVRANNSILSSYIQRYLMEVSGYSKHALAVFYRTCVTKMLKTGDFDFIKLSLPEGYNKRIYKKKVNELIIEAKKLRRKCFGTVFEMVQNKKAQFNERLVPLKKEIRKTIKALQKINDKNSDEFQSLYNQYLAVWAEMKNEQNQYRGEMQAQILREINSWQHFTNKQESSLKAMNQLQKEIVEIREEITEEKEKMKRAKGRGARKSMYSEYKQIENNLLIEEEMYFHKILKTTVMDRLVTAYHQSATPATLSDSLVETVLETFQQPNDEIPEDFATRYYQEQRKLLIAKNKYAIKIKRAKENLVVLNM